MRIFQVKTNKALPAMGSILIASPLLSDYHFARTVILMVTHNEEGSMGIVMNQMFHHDITLNELIPGLDSVPGIPVFKGGPIGRDTIFFIHTINALEGALTRSAEQRSELARKLRTAAGRVRELEAEIAEASTAAAEQRVCAGLPASRRRAPDRSRFFSRSFGRGARGSRPCGRNGR